MNKYYKRTGYRIKNELAFNLLWYAFFLLIYSVVLFLRRPDAIELPQFWAEDAAIFFQQANQYGIKSISLATAGYLNVVPRIIALAAHPFGYTLAPAFYSYSCFVITVLAGIIIFSTRLDVSRTQKLLLALSLVLIPHGGEVFLTTTNIQWILAPVTVLLLLQSEPQNLKEFIYDAVLLLLTGLTGPFIVFFLPLLVLKIFNGAQRRYTLLICGEVILLASIQIYSIINNNVKDLTSFVSITWFTAIFINFVGGLIIGAFDPKINITDFWIITPLFYLSIILIITSASNNTRRMILGFLLGSSTVYLSALYSSKNNPAEIHAFFGGQRYFYIPYVLICWSYIIAISNKNFTRYISIVMLSIILLASFSRFSWPPLVDYKWKEYVKLYEQGQKVQVPINPPGWSIILDPKQGQANSTVTAPISKEDSAWKSRLYSPTYLVKYEDLYFVVDCWHNRILYSREFYKDISQWQLLDSDLAGPHSIASDGYVYIAEDTGRGRLKVYVKDGESFRVTQIINNIGNRPHRVIYNQSTSAFYVIASESQSITKLIRGGDGTVKVVYTKPLKFLDKAYTRSFSIIDSYMYFVSGQGRITKTTFTDDIYTVVASYKVPNQISSMNDLFKLGNYYYLTGTPKAVIRTHSLAELESGNYEDIYDVLGLKGTPYYFSIIGGRVFLPQVNENNGIMSFSEQGDNIRDVQSLLDFGLPTTADVREKKRLPK